MFRLLFLFTLSLALSSGAVAAVKWNNSSSSSNAECGFGCKPDSKTLELIRSTSKNDSNELDLVETNHQTEEFPRTFFAGFGSKWFLNIHNWGDGGTGKGRYFALTEKQIQTIASVAPYPIRLQINVENFLFWEKCKGRSELSYDVHNQCYEQAFKEASKSGWKTELDSLRDISSHPMFGMYLNAVKQINNKDLPVIIVPTDFFWGRNQNAISATHDPLLYQYLENDETFQKVYIKFSNALVAELAKQGVSKMSFQSINEARYCGADHKSPVLGSWQKLERRIFEAVRMAAPKIHLIGTAVCTAGHGPIKGAKRLKNIGNYIAAHPDLENISYAVHFRNPRILHHANFYKLSSINYPYQKLKVDKSKGEYVDEPAQREYERLKPNRKHYERLFADLSAFAKKNDIHLIITEWSVSKPDYGLKNEQRLNLMADILGAAKNNNISIIYNGIFGRDGIGLGKDNLSRPSSNFDPNILNLWKKTNSIE